MVSVHVYQVSSCISRETSKDTKKSKNGKLGLYRLGALITTEVKLEALETCTCRMEALETPVVHLSKEFASSASHNYYQPIRESLHLLTKDCVQLQEPAESLQ